MRFSPTPKGITLMHNNPPCPPPTLEDHECIATLQKMEKTEQQMQRTRLFGQHHPQPRARRLTSVRPGLVALSEP